MMSHRAVFVYSLAKDIPSPPRGTNNSGGIILFLEIDILSMLILHEKCIYIGDLFANYQL